MEPVVYFDMDGVLAIFDETCPKTVVLSPGTHYFRTCLPDPRAVFLLQWLNHVERTKTAVFTRLFSFLEDSLKAEQAADKRLWCGDMLGREYTNNGIFLCTDAGKHDLLRSVPAENRKFHILIDDDPIVLSDWRQTGGSCIQYMQPGRRITARERTCIRPEHSFEDAMEILEKAIRGVMAEKET